MALASMLARRGSRGDRAAWTRRIRWRPRPPHFAAKAKRVIFLFMAGGPSQLELFDYKPKLQELDGQIVPPEYTKNKRFAFIKGDAKLLGTQRKFARHGAVRRRAERAVAAPGRRSSTTCAS